MAFVSKKNRNLSKGNTLNSAVSTHSIFQRDAVGETLEIKAIWQGALHSFNHKLFFFWHCVSNRKGLFLGVLTKEGQEEKGEEESKRGRVDDNFLSISHYPPSKKLLTQKKIWEIVFGVIATLSRNQLRKRILWELFSRELRKFRVAQHGESEVSAAANYAK